MMPTVCHPRPRALGSAIALVLACLWIGAPMHAHESMVSGWHDATPHGCPHRNEQGPCSLCRLAQETSCTPLTLQHLATPELRAELPAAVVAPQPSSRPRGADGARAPPLRPPAHVA